MQSAQVKAFKIANDYFDDISHIPGYKRNELNLTNRYSYWRKCVTSLVIFFWMGFSICDILLNLQTFRQLDAQIKSFPDIFEKQIKLAIWVMAGLQFLVSFISVVALWRVMQSYRQKFHYPNSAKRIIESWFVFLFMTGMLYLIVPIGALIDSELMAADICAYSVAGLSGMGEPMRLVIAHEAKTHVPKIANYLHAPPPTTIDGIRKWPVHQWCREDKAWRQKLFGRESMQVVGVGGSLSTQGLLPSCIQLLGVLVGTDISVCAASGTSLIEPDFAKLGEQLQAHMPVADWRNKTALDRLARLKAEAAEAERQYQLESLRFKVGTQLATTSPHEQKHSNGLNRARIFRGKDHPAAMLRREDKLADGRTNVTTLNSLSMGGRSIQEHQQLHAPHNVVLTNASHGIMMEKQIPSANTLLRVQELAICSSLAGVKTYSLISTIMPVFLSNIFGVYVSVKVMTSVVPVIYSFLSGVQYGIANAKHAMPTASLPGYILCMFVLGAIPSVLAIFGLISQILSSFPAGFAITFFVTSLIYQIRVGCIYADVNEMGSQARRELSKRLRKARQQESYLYLLTVVCMLVWMAIRVRDLYNSATLDSSLGEALNLIKQVLEPLNLINMSLRAILMYYLSTLASTDIIMMVTFDVMDDRIHIRQDGEIVSEKKLNHLWKTFTHNQTMVDLLPGGAYGTHSEKKIRHVGDADEANEGNPASTCYNCGTPYVKDAVSCWKCGKERKGRPEGGVHLSHEK